jgi:cation:H+ antiporter
MNLLLFVGGLNTLVLGANRLVRGASKLALPCGVSPRVVGLTVVAFGTRAPEVTVSVGAMLDGRTDLAIGNVVGNNVFNMLGCLGLSGLFAGHAGLVMAPSLLSFDIWVMLAVALTCLPVFFIGREVARWEGAVFLACCIAYVAYLILAAQHHDALPVFSAAMLTFVLPLTALTFVVLLLRRGPASAP